MVRHIVMWDFKDEYSDEEKRNNAIKIKTELETLATLISGVISIEVIINPLTSSNSDMMLNSLFDSEEDLNAYQENPHHIAAAKFVRLVTTNRRCIDYIE